VYCIFIFLECLPLQVTSFFTRPKIPVLIGKYQGGFFIQYEARAVP